jgi:hypothetical protein
MLQSMSCRQDRRHSTERSMIRVLRRSKKTAYKTIRRDSISPVAKGGQQNRVAQALALGFSVLEGAKRDCHGSHRPEEGLPEKSANSICTSGYASCATWVIEIVRSQYVLCGMRLRIASAAPGT